MSESDKRVSDPDICCEPHHASDEEEAVVKVDACTRCVSIKNCTLLLCGTCIAATAALCVGLAVHSSDQALQARRQQFNEANSAFTVTSLGSLERLSSDFVDSLTQAQSDALQAKLSEFALQAKVVRDDIITWPSRGISDENPEDFFSSLSLSTWSVIANSLDFGPTGNQASPMGIGLAHRNGHYFWMHDDPFQPENSSLSLLSVQQVSTTEGHRGEAALYTGELNQTYCCAEPDCAQVGRCPVRGKSVTDFFFWDLGMSRLQPRELRWTPLFMTASTDPREPLGNTVALGVVCSWVHLARESERVGVIMAGMSVEALTRSVGEIARGAAPGSKIRMFTVVHEEWLYTSMSPGEAAAQDIKDQKGLLTSASHGEAYYSYESADCPGCDLRWPRADWNATDPIIQGIAEVAQGNYGTFNETRQIWAKVERGGVLNSEQNFVRSAKVFTEGVDWWLVTSIDRAYVLGSVENIIGEAETVAKAGKDDVDSRLEEDRNVLYIAVVAVAVALVLASVIFVLRVSTPLSRLLVEMQLVSQMDVDKVDVTRPLSGLAEVRSMERSFRKMIDNLREFRKYMPASILDNDTHDDELEGRISAVPAPDGNVTLVFTDIRGSTSLWETVTSAMAQALKLHNSIVRKAIADHGGYEVKTVGDAFFVVFPTPESACRFGIEVQAELCRADWPRELGESGLPQVRASKLPSGQWLWNGIRVRIGIHCGECELEFNPTTGRADYFGPPVNIAARLEAAGAGGFTGVSDTVVEAVGGESALRAMGAGIVPLGMKDLKGVGRKIPLTGLVPKGLEGRVEILDQNGVEIKDKKAEKKTSSTRATKTRVLDRLRTALTAVRGTVAQVSTPLEWQDGGTVDHILEQANQHISATELAAERTEGLLQHCTGSQLLVTWNAGRRCANTQDQSSVFVTLLYRRWMHNTHLNGPTCGLSSGTLLCGNLGGQAQGARRFATVVGGAVELAAALALYARDWATRALISNLDRSPMPRSFARPLVKWQVKEWDTSIVVVYELDVDGLQNHDDTVSSPDEEDEAPWVSTTYCQAFDEGDTEHLKMLALKRPTDSVLQRVAAGTLDPIPAWWLSCGLNVPDEKARQRNRASGSSLAEQGGTSPLQSPPELQA
eukprot:Hpha_TRINITY_DN11064_c0_g1::TRINITY_DN11064_c0_g1_i1::g.92717::m.92717